jgi:hypothetical protein
MIGCSNKQTNHQSNTLTQSQQSNDKSNNTKSDNITAAGVKTNSTGNEKAADKKSNSYNVTENIYKIANITLKYPQISNLGDDNKQEKINKLIKDSVIDGYNLTVAIKTGILPDYKEPIENLTLDVIYSIELQSSNILSIKYLGQSNMKNSAHPNNELYTTNVDINNVRVLKLSDMVTINQSLVNAFRKGNYVPWSKDFTLTQSDINNTIGIYNDRDLQTALEQSDKPNGLVNPFYTHCYLTKDGIVIGIGVAHAAGDHAEFKIPYNSIKSNLKTEIKLS